MASGRRSTLGPRLEAALDSMVHARVDEWTAAAFEYFDRERQPNELFNVLASLWLPNVAAAHRGIDPISFGLNAARAWEDAHPGERLHKGTPYYFLGMATILAGDLDYGFLYMHQALREDQLSSGRQDPPQPALFFVTMDAQKAEPAFQPQVQHYADYVGARLTDYRTSGRGSLDLATLRAVVLSRSSLVESMFHLVYATARTLRLEEIAIEARQTVFGRNLYSQALFDLCIVAEEWLRYAWPMPGDELFAALTDRYASATGLALTQTERAEVRRAAEDPANWGTVLNSLVDGSYRTSAGTGRAMADREADILVAYLIRNRSAHTLTADAILERHFEDVERRLYWAIFAIAEHLP